MKRRQFLKVSAAAALVRCVPLPAQSSSPPSTELPPNARRLICHWKAGKHGKYSCDLTVSNRGPFDFTQLFVNGQQQILARFPHATPSGAPNFVTGVGYLRPGAIVPDFGDSINLHNLVAIEFDPATFGDRHWSNPEEAVLCLKTPDGIRRIPVVSIDYDSNLIWCAPGDGPASLDLHSVPQFYVENVYDELNASHEWYLNRKQGILYYKAPHGLDMTTAVIDAAWPPRTLSRLRNID